MHTLEAYNRQPPSEPGRALHKYAHKHQNTLKNSLQAFQLSCTNRRDAARAQHFSIYPTSGLSSNQAWRIIPFWFIHLYPIYFIQDL